MEPKVDFVKEAPRFGENWSDGFHIVGQDKKSWWTTDGRHKVMAYAHCDLGLGKLKVF